MGMMEMSELTLVQDAKMDILRGLNVLTDRECPCVGDIYGLAKSYYYLREAEKDLMMELREQEEMFCAQKKMMSSQKMGSQKMDSQKMSDSRQKDEKSNSAQ